MVPSNAQSCRRCNGSGREFTNACSVCGGSGWMSVGTGYNNMMPTGPVSHNIGMGGGMGFTQSTQANCGQCQGSGRKFTSNCPGCSGKGIVLVSNPPKKCQRCHGDGK